MFEGFELRHVKVNGVEIAFRIGGKGAPLLMLHGFPQTHAMWAQIAPKLASSFTVVCSDLRGYGASGKPLGVENYSFKEMGIDQLELMSKLGFEKFRLIGHDRGARTAHRMALEAGERLQSLVLMDIVPTHLLLDQLSKEVARAYYHWLFLAQPSPFPETLIQANSDYYYESCLLGWGAGRISDFAPDQLAAYRAAWRDAETIRAMCDDYRAAIDYDFALDDTDFERKVKVPTLILWGADGAMAKNYDMRQTWRDRLETFEKATVPGGHFFPDTAPEATTAKLLEFLRE